jgi:hypothetical protein
LPSLEKTVLLFLRGLVTATAAAVHCITELRNYNETQVKKGLLARIRAFFGNRYHKVKLILWRLSLCFVAVMRFLEGLSFRFWLAANMFSVYGMYNFFLL